MALTVTPKTLPAAGVDTIDITIEETYQVDGIGEDQVTLKGNLVGERTSPLLGFGEEKDSWDTSTVVARFSKLELYGNSKVFGPVIVTLDDSVPAFGVVKAGKCAAALPIQVTMPNHNLVLKSDEPVQLRSDVLTVPPIGDEKTESVRPVKLIHSQTLRPMGTMLKAKVAWRELSDQTVSLQKDRLAFNITDGGGNRSGGVEEQLANLTAKIIAILQEIESVKSELKKK